MFKGSCICGSIQFELKAAPEAVMSCFCLDCKKNSGHLGQLMAQFSEEDVNINDEDGLLKSYVIIKTESGIPKTKFFCGRCGCNIMSKPGSNAGKAMVRFTLLDSGIENFKPTAAYSTEERDNLKRVWKTEHM